MAVLPGFISFRFETKRPFLGYPGRMKMEGRSLAVAWFGRSKAPFRRTSGLRSQVLQFRVWPKESLALETSSWFVQGAYESPRRDHEQLDKSSPRHERSRKPVDHDPFNHRLQIRHVYHTSFRMGNLEGHWPFRVEQFH